MDLETENRIAAMLMKEAAELRRQAEKEGVNVYLRQPKPRVRPNSRFLTATVVGVQQANRSVEVNEMWRVRQKELELDSRLKGKPVDHRSNGARYRDGSSPKSTSKRPAATNDSVNASCSSSKDFHRSSYSRNDEGLRDEELEEFLHSRAKRGRGAVGPRMDETGPYLPCSPDSGFEQSTILDVEKRRVIYGPEKPSSFKSSESSEEETDDDRTKKKPSSFKPSESSEEETDDDRQKKKPKKDPSRSSKKQHSEKRRSKSKSKDKKKRKEKKSRHKK